MVEEEVGSVFVVQAVLRFLSSTDWEPSFSVCLSPTEACMEVGVFQQHFWPGKGKGDSCWASTSMEVDDEVGTTPTVESPDDPAMGTSPMFSTSVEETSSRVHHQPSFLACSSGGNLTRGGVAAHGYIETHPRFHDPHQRQALSLNRGLPVRRSFSSSNLLDR